MVQRRKTTDLTVWWGDLDGKKWSCGERGAEVVIQLRLVFGKGRHKLTKLSDSKLRVGKIFLDDFLFHKIIIVQAFAHCPYRQHLYAKHKETKYGQDFFQYRAAKVMQQPGPQNVSCEFPPIRLKQNQNLINKAINIFVY